MKKNYWIYGKAMSFQRWKTFLIMKLLSVFILGFILQSYAFDSQAQDKLLNIRFENNTLKEVLQKLEDQTEFSFIYKDELVKSVNNVSGSFTEDNVTDLLNKIFRNTDLSYTVKGRTIVILSKYSEVGSEQQKTFTGKVTDSSGTPVPGVSVVVKGTTNGTITDVNGSYSLTNIPANSTLQFSFVGMKMQEIAIGNKTSINVVMEEEAIGIDEVVAVGYSTQRKKDLTGAIGSVSEKNIEKASIISPDEALRGKVSGVQVHTNSHSPGGGMAVQVRGTSSISAGGSPLYVIDGVPISNNTDSGKTTDAGTYGAPPNPLSSIDPSDIASIQILKDASSTAIYGSRATNGVVLITTKRGKYNQQNINLDMSYGIATLSNKLPFLTGQQWAQQANDRADMLKLTRTYTDQEVAAFGKGTDWQNEVYQPAAKKTYKLTFSGGTESVRYLISGNISDQEGIVKGSSFKRYGTTVNLDANVNKRLTIGESLIFNITNNTIVPTDTKGYEGVSNVIDAIYEALPTVPARDSNGLPSVIANYPLGGGRENPLVMTDKYKEIASTGRVISNTFANYNIAKGLDFKVSFGFDINDFRYHEYFPIGSEADGGANGKASQSSSKDINISNSNVLTYQTSINNVHKITLLGGYTYQKDSYEILRAASYGYPMDFFMYNNLGLGSSVQAPGSSKNGWALSSYISRANYVFRDKYMLTASLRVDGSSKFGKNNKYGYFPSVSMAWQLKEEKFIKNLQVFSELKLRTSFGKTGNEDIGVYRSLSLIGTEFGSRSSYIYGTSKVPIAYPQNLANPDLSWEKASEYNVGLDMGVLKDRLTVSLDYYYKKTTDLLLSVPVPTQTGFGSVLKNAGSMLNKGFEVDINSINTTGKFNWNTNFNISLNRNEILSLGGAAYIYTGWVGGGNVTPHDKNTARLQPGHAVGEFYGSVYEGIWKSQAEIKEVGTMPSAKPGDIRYKDVNGDGKYDTEKDDIFLGNPNPDFTFGFTNDFNYKNWSLHVFMYGEYGNDVLNLAAQQTALDGLGVSAKRLDAWSTSNPNGAYPSAGASNPQRVSSILVEDGSFLRIQNVTLGYSLPIKGMLVGKVKSARLSLAADNLAILTGYSGYDPEVNSYGNSNSSKGMDRFGYPPSRIFSFSISLGF